MLFQPKCQRDAFGNLCKGTQWTNYRGSEALKKNQTEGNAKVVAAVWGTYI